MVVVMVEGGGLRSNLLSSTSVAVAVAVAVAVVVVSHSCGLRGLPQSSPGPPRFFARPGSQALQLHPRIPPRRKPGVSLSDRPGPPRRTSSWLQTRSSANMIFTRMA